MSTISVTTKRIPILRALGREGRGALQFELRDVAVILVCLAALALTSSADHWFSTSPILRVALGLLYVFAIPGYCLTAILFPSRHDLEPLERLGLSVGGSIALTPILAAVLDRLGWGLHYWTISAAEGILTSVLLAAAVIRRASLPANSRFAFGASTQREAATGWSASMRPVIYGLVMALAVTAALGAWARWGPAGRPDLTEFYVLSANGVAEGYPRSVPISEPLSATFGVVNHQPAEQRFRIVGWAVDGWNAERREQVLDLPDLVLPAGQRAVWSTEWRMPWAGSDQMTELVLYRDGVDRPYRRLRLWVNVLPDHAGQSQVPPAQPASVPLGAWGIREPAPAPIVLAPVPQAGRTEPVAEISVTDILEELVATPAELTVPSTVESSAAAAAAPATIFGTEGIEEPAPMPAEITTASTVEAAPAPAATPATIVLPDQALGPPVQNGTTAAESIALSPPAAPALAAAAPVWMTSSAITQMWSDSEQGMSFGQTTAACAFLVLDSPPGNRVYVLNPLTKNYLWIERQALIPANPPALANGPAPANQNCSATVSQYPVRGTVLDERYGQGSTATSGHLEAPSDGAHRVLEAPVGNQIGDVILDATIRPLTTQSGGSFGLVIRTGREDAGPGADQPGRFYAFRVSVDGTLTVSSRANGQWVELSRSQAPGPVGERVRLTATASGDELLFSIDGIDAVRVRDSMFADGGVGIFVDGPTTSVAVERLTVQVPY